MVKFSAIYLWKEPPTAVLCNPSEVKVLDEQEQEPVLQKFQNDSMQLEL